MITNIAPPAVGIVDKQTEPSVFIWSLDGAMGFGALGRYFQQGLMGRS